MGLSEQIHRVVRRASAFYQSPTPGHLLIHCEIPVERPPLPPLNDFDLHGRLDKWMQALLAYYRPLWELKKDLDDDTLPNICPWFGIAEHSAWTGAEVHLQETTSLPIPFIHNIEDVENLAFTPDQPWYRLMKRGYELLRRWQDDTYVISLRGTMAPLDIANAIRGNDIFTDFVLQPELVHRLLARLCQGIRWYFDQLIGWTDRVEGGTVFWITGGWMPFGTLGHLSNDAALLCSAECYETFSYPVETELARHYKGLLYHVHNEKWHYVPKLASLPGMRLLEVSNDPNALPSLENLETVYRHTGNCNLLLHGTSDQVRAHIGELTQRNVFLQVACRDKADARDLVQLLRSQSAFKLE
ncbi:hypothetical protein JW992_03130 [candidate division KSB1 bacterium]|nr:hypothetical protein [candidate division KSB1 bacterium]